MQTTKKKKKKTINAIVCEAYINYISERAYRERGSTPNVRYAFTKVRNEIYHAFSCFQISRSLRVYYIWGCLSHSKPKVFL